MLTHLPISPKGNRKKAPFGASFLDEFERVAVLEYILEGLVVALLDSAVHILRHILLNARILLACTAVGGVVRRFKVVH